jgi:hypothetical protein
VEAERVRVILQLYLRLRSGRLFVSAHLWTGAQHATGVLRQDAGGSWTRIAGEAWGSTDEGVAATSAQLDLAALSFDSAGDLWLAEGSSHIVRRIDMTDGNIYTVRPSLRPVSPHPPNATAARRTPNRRGIDRLLVEGRGLGRDTRRGGRTFPDGFEF